MSFIQTLIQKVFSSSQNNVTNLLNTVYDKNQDSKKQFFAENVDHPQLLSIEHLAKYFNLTSEDMIEVFLTFPKPWIGKTVRGYLPTDEGHKHGAKEAYANYESYTLWDESILFNETLINQINIKINTEVYQIPNIRENSLDTHRLYSYT